MNSDFPVQVDGEPWLQTPCAITIIKSALKVEYNLNFFLIWILEKKVDP